MKRFYLSGQHTFSNRGCEAIVRSTVAGLLREFGDITVLVPSDDIERDKGQWPEAKDYGVRFVKAYLPRHARYWVHSQRLPIAHLKRAGWPFPFPRWLKEQIASVDAVLSVGGDNYSLDYRLPSLLIGIDGLAMDMGKPVILWGASVGPFEREPHFISTVRAHLARFSALLVRESTSFRYLTESLGLNNVRQMVDPAFILEPEMSGAGAFWPLDRMKSVVGLNVSPLIERYKRRGQDLLEETSAFVRNAVEEQGYGVLLVPHVIPLDGARRNNDAHYMKELLRRCADLSDSVAMLPATLNAAQLKHVIGNLRFFIGARTHATIAALSSGVPTISIAYSIKARGINRDLFDDKDLVLPTPELSKETLIAKFAYLRANEDELRAILATKTQEYRNIVYQHIREIQSLI